MALLLASGNIRPFLPTTFVFPDNSDPTTPPAGALTPVNADMVLISASPAAEFMLAFLACIRLTTTTGFYSGIRVVWGGDYSHCSDTSSTRFIEFTMQSGAMCAPTPSIIIPNPRVLTYRAFDALLVQR